LESNNRFCCNSDCCRGFCIKTLTDYAKRFIGLPYIFGGQHPAQGYDCSGLVQHILQSVGVDPQGDQTAMTLYNYFSEFGKISTPQAGALSFYGRNVASITHIAFMVSEFQLVEAGGGYSTTTDIQKSIEAEAFVRMRPFGHRKDLVAVLMPTYPTWVING
jgi:cell wall-associated NlpC family hydrolase